MAERIEVAMRLQTDCRQIWLHSSSLCPKQNFSSLTVKGGVYMAYQLPISVLRQANVPNVISLAPQQK
jgi:hypothetical protein